jgi:hypothetical protein
MLSISSSPGSQQTPYYSNATRGRLKKEESEPYCYVIEDEYPKKINRSLGKTY